MGLLKKLKNTILDSNNPLDDYGKTREGLPSIRKKDGSIPASNEDYVKAMQKMQNPNPPVLNNVQRRPLRPGEKPQLDRLPESSPEVSSTNIGATERRKLRESLARPQKDRRNVSTENVNLKESSYPSVGSADNMDWDALRAERMRKKVG